jgi:hypothetical protein
MDELLAGRDAERGRRVRGAGEFAESGQNALASAHDEAGRPQAVAPRAAKASGRVEAPGEGEGRLDKLDPERGRRRTRSSGSERP